MVNLGRSNGCQTCKKRRIKCDEAKPNCHRCLQAGRECGGYMKKPVDFRFKDDLKLAPKPPYQRHQAAPVLADARKPSPIPALSPVQRDVALGFFVNCFSTTGRNCESARGLFEIMGPAVAKEHPSSAVSVAVTAVAMKMHALWRHGAKAVPSPQCLETHSLALSRLQRALRDQKELRSKSTVLAALVLQCHETLTAAWDQRPPAFTHHEGAVALFLSQSPDIDGSALYDTHLLTKILHDEVSSALREQRPVSPRICLWLSGDDKPLSLISTLDLIGVSIAKIQVRFLRLLDESQPDPTPRQTQSDIEELWADIRSTDNELIGWFKTFPREWRPLKVRQAKEADPPIISYSDGYDIYPSIAIAAVWNTWRCYRLMLLKMALVLLHEKADAVLVGITTSHGFDTTTKVMSWVEDNIRSLFDSVCDSVPFHLGNCIRRSTLYDFTDPGIVHPSYHDLSLHKAILLEHPNSNRFMSFEDHRHNVIAQGPWHILSPLGQLLRLLSSRFGHLLAQKLRQGQKDWIQQQLTRATVVLDWEHTKK
ncbi:hypothetical protein BKA56DRAFT_595892 [Ilyonectria sp. MPI-CAGE-AT-0026]|nr:hypothetical protein BKA56DRAFT_595892 [Ilyonectria sp. MPI-CAGE-AT-0026]